MARFQIYKWIIIVGSLMILPFIIGTVATLKNIRLYNMIQEAKATVNDESYYTLEKQNNNSENTFLLLDRMFSDVVEYDCSVKSYKPHVNKTKSELTLHTAEIVICGPFIQIVKFLEHIEHIVADSPSLIYEKVASIIFQNGNGSLEASITIQKLSVI